MQYEEFDPPEGLRDHVLALWSFRGPPAAAAPVLHSVPPDGCMGVAVALRLGRPVEVAIIGAHDGPLTVPIFPGDRYWGVRFWPDAGAACLGIDPVTWCGRRGPAVEASGGLVTVLVDALPDASPDDHVRAQLERWAQAVVAGASPLDPVVRLAVVAIVASRGTMPIASLPGTVGVSSRTLLRRFRAATGLTLKRYAKVRRFREAAAQHLQTPGITWSRIAADVGYADHAHLTREFRELVGAPPRDVARLIGRISHGAHRP